MALLAYADYMRLHDRANQMALAAGRLPSFDDRALFFHASLAAHVAFWEAYVKKSILEYYDKTSNPLDSKFHKVHMLSKGYAEEKLKKFNTPNSDNVRVLLINSTGFDPWSSWNIKVGRTHYPSLQSRSFLDEVLKVRHSFSHGFPMPKYAWNVDGSGRPRINKDVIRKISGFYFGLVKSTDAAFENYITHL
jgi:hypothetical protein